MRLFQMVAICMIAVVASLFVLAGCEGAGAENNKTAREQLDQCCNEGYHNSMICDSCYIGSEDDCEFSLWLADDECINGHYVELEPKSGLVIATAPNDFVGDFYFDEKLECKATNSCKAEIKGLVFIEFKRTDALFLTKPVAGQDKEQTVTWDEPGDWGLAPNGTYIDKYGVEFEVETKIDNGSVSLIIHGSDEDGTPVQGDKLIYNGPEGTVEGSISSDLKTITKKIYVIASDKTFTRIFTLVE